MQCFQAQKIDTFNIWSTSIRGCLSWSSKNHCGLDSRKGTDVLNACKTLDYLRGVLLEEGYILSHAALYLCFIPRRSDTVEGKRHVHTFLVKIRKAKNNLRNKYQDTKFTFATKHYLKDIASLLGSENYLLYLLMMGSRHYCCNRVITIFNARDVWKSFTRSKYKLTPLVYPARKIQITFKAVPETSYSVPV